DMGDSVFRQSDRDRVGGISLADLPKNITVGTVVRRMEDDFHLVECFDREHNRCPITPVCGLRGVLGKALHAYLSILDEYTLEDLLFNREGLREILHT